MATISGGRKLEAALHALSAKLAKPATLRVGFLQGATYPDGKSVAMIAAIQEFGAPSAGVPPRPFFRNMVASQSPKWAAALAQALEANDNDAARALALMGEAIAGELRASIIDTNAPPLAPATVARKGFSKPLIDTSVMINSIDYEIT
jgi:hypothetical protein